MKKGFMFLLLGVMLATTLWFNTGVASAASGTKVVVFVPGVTNKDAKHATLFADSNYQPLYCVVKDSETGETNCHVPAKYAGQTVRIYIGGQIVYATVPTLHAPKREPKREPASTCTPPEEEVVTVYFTDSLFNGADWSWDVPVSEVDNFVAGYIDFIFSSYTVGDPFCGVPSDNR